MPTMTAQSASAGNEGDAAHAAADVAPTSPPSHQPARRRTGCLDGNEAVARVAHAMSDIVAIYPITPSSAMGEHAEAWSAAGVPNIWGDVPEVIQMQSEAGAAGTLHGALLTGALATTFTASQGLLLMLPNMFKIAGELTPAVIHVAARAVATHALSIFGDHSDVMTARSTGWAMLAASSVQEAQDFAAVAHAATLDTRVPFVHFFDGFRTSHQIDTLALLDHDDLRALHDPAAVRAHRARGLTPDAPVIRGTAQDPDVYFQSREAANRFHAAVPAAVQARFDQLADRTGRQYDLVEYAGAPDAERVLVVMGSAAGAAAEAVEALAGRGERVGLVTVRLFRPFPVAELAAALPATVRRIAVLDRTKEPGAVGEPLYTDVVAALAERGRRDAEVVGVRYGLGGKEFTPAMAKAVLDELTRPDPRRHATVGITDDVTALSIPVDDSFTVPRAPVQAVFYGLGSDGTVGANKASVKLVAEQTGMHAQGYFVYDSKKAGSVTVSHLRFSPDPITSTYLIGAADFVGVHQFSLLTRRRPLEVARPGATVLINSPHPADRVWTHLPVEVQQEVIDKRLQVHVVDAYRVAREAGLAGRVNTVMQTCFFALTDLLPDERTEPMLVASARSAYARKGTALVDANVAAIRAALTGLAQVQIPDRATGSLHRLAAAPAHAPAFVRDVTAALLAGDGNRLPVSALPPDGTFPTDTGRWEKRGIAAEAPAWEPDLCTGCGKCTLVCPHAAIRMSIFDLDSAAEDPAIGDLPSTRFTSRELPNHRLTIAVSPLDCTACGLCVAACPVVDPADPTRKPLAMTPIEGRVEAEQARFEAVAALPRVDRAKLRTDTIKGSQLLEPLFTFSGACAGCGETPYLKLLSQLCGDRLIVANATGCSSIFGGNLPTTPWSTNSCGQGPAWANSLFEDNAEFGLGIRLAADRQHAAARRLLAEHADIIGRDLVDAILAASSGPVHSEAELASLRRLIARLRDRLHDLAPDADARPDGDDGLRDLATVVNDLIERSVWTVGGDGWAYDIGYGGLDHVLASGRNVNILVLDTEVYSNTGGQASKATPRGAVAKFATAGKHTGKKDLGRLAQGYGDVYVAQIAMGANEMQTLRALREAQAWPGVSLVIAYASCVEHGIEMSEGLEHQRRAVASGYWPLYRFRPDPDGGAAMSIDSKPPNASVRDFMSQQGRFSQLADRDPDRAELLAARTQDDVDRRWADPDDDAGRQSTDDKNADRGARPR